MATCIVVGVLLASHILAFALGAYSVKTVQDVGKGLTSWGK